MGGFPSWRLRLTKAICIAALAMPAVAAAEPNEDPSNARTPTQPWPDEGVAFPDRPTDQQSDAEAEPQAAEPVAPAPLTRITTQSIEANANVDLPQDI